MTDRATRIMVGACTVILVVAALHLARSVLAPVAFALFIIALVWPFQRAFQARMPKLLALLLTMLLTLFVVAGIAALVIWGFGRVGQWLLGNGAQLQALYARKTAWLEGYGIFVASLIAEHFDMRWLVRVAQDVMGQLQGFVSFAVVTLVFTLLGLLEVDVARRQLEALGDRDGPALLLRSGAVLARKLQRYMLVRSVMSLVTGLAIWGFATAAGLELAMEWGVIAFALNYIPFIGSLLATIFPTMFAVLQFESWQMAVIVFLSLNLIQFTSGSYLEPRIAGATLAVSPFLVLFAVFFWALLWGIAGAFIGVPVMIALLTLCDQHPSSRWVAQLLSGRDGRVR